MEQDQPQSSTTLFRNPSVFAADYIPELAPSRAARWRNSPLTCGRGMVGATPHHVVCSPADTVHQRENREGACIRRDPPVLSTESVLFSIAPTDTFLGADLEHNAAQLAAVSTTDCRR